MAECGRPVGKGVVVFPCQVGSGHQGPCAAPEHPASTRQREAWARAQEAESRAAQAEQEANPLVTVPIGSLAADDKAADRGGQPVPTHQPGSPSMHDKLIDQLFQRPTYFDALTVGIEAVIDLLSSALGFYRQELIDMVLERKALGLNRYGTILQAHNGRDARKDAADEAIDLLVYLLQVKEERDNPQ